MITIANEIARNLVPWERLAELLGGPHAAVEWPVTATSMMQRRSYTKMTNTNRSRHVAVGTTKKSAAVIWPIRFVRNVPHVCEGGRRCRGMYFATVAWLTAIPSFSSSP